MAADAVELAPGVTRLLAPNPSLMTGPGTNTWLLGRTASVVLDPGPAIASHIENILRITDGYIAAVVVTHTHPDHSPAAAQLALETGAELVGRPAPAGRHQDPSFVPDRDVADGDVLAFDDFVLQAVATPGHASNHVCYWHEELDWLFTGDHVIDGSTVVIDPPDGDMRDYIDSLHKVRALDCSRFAPGHGDLIRDPVRVVDWLIGHRLGRERKVLAAMRAHPGLTVRELVPHAYRDIAPSLYRLAERSLLAHALKLEVEDRAVQDGERWRVL